MKTKKIIAIMISVTFIFTGNFYPCRSVSADISVYDNEGEYAAGDGTGSGDVSDDNEKPVMGLSETGPMEGENGIDPIPENNLIRQEADLAVEKYEKKKSLREHWAEKKVNKNISVSRKYLSKGKNDKARKYAYRALEISPENVEIAALLTEINKADMFGARVREEKIIGIREKMAFQDTGKREDPMYKYNEPGGVWAAVLNIFSKREFRPSTIIRKKQLSVEECVNLALSRSQKKIVAQKQIHLAEMKLWEVRRELFPEVSAKYELSSGSITSGGFNRHYRGKKYGVETKYTVFDGFEKWFNVKQSQLNYEVVNLENEKIENEIVQETKEAYYNVDKAEKSLGIQNEHKERINNLFSITEQAYNEGVIPKVEYLKVKGENMQADFQYTSAEEDLELARMMLFQSLDMEPDPDIGIFPMETPESMVSIGLENCYKLAYANRPDFKIKEKMIEHNDLERKKMKAKGWPKIDFHGNFGASYENFEPVSEEIYGDNTGDEAGNPIRGDRTIEGEWFAGVTGSIPLWGNTFEYNYVREKWAPTVSSFRGSSSATSYFKLNLLDDLKYFTNIRDSRVGFETAKLEYMDLKKDIAVEVKEAYFKYRKALLQKEVAKAQLEHQNLYMEILEERRRYGEMEVSRVIEEYDKLVEYQFSDVQAEATYFISLTQINKAIGVSNYFIPDQEKKVYEEWEKEFQAEDQNNVSAGKKKGMSETYKAKKAEKYIKLSEKYLRREDFEKAKRYARKAEEYLSEDNAGIEYLNKRISENEEKYLEEKQKEIERERLEKEAEAVREKREKEEKALVEQNKKAQKNIDKARKYYDKGKYPLARKYLYKALSAQPDNSEAKELLSAAEEKLSQ